MRRWGNIGAYGLRCGESEGGGEGWERGGKEREREIGGFRMSRGRKWERKGKVDVLQDWLQRVF